MDTLPLSDKRKFVVGNKKFNNNIHALQHFSKNPKEKLYFDLGYNFINNELLWKVEPPEDISVYLKQHAEYLSSIYDNIILYYSGGTDSHTILNAFFAAEITNIKLIINDNEKTEVEKYNPKTPSITSPNSHVASELYFKYKDKIDELNYTIDSLTFYQKMKPCSYNEYYNFLKNGNFGDFEGNLRKDFLFADQISNQSPIIAKKDANKKRTCIIAGREKPRVRLINNTTWAWEINSQFAQDVYGKVDDDNADFIDFYFSDAIPEIQIKLTWLKIKAIEKIVMVNELPLCDQTIDEIQSNSSEYYTMVNSAMGYSALNPYLFSNLSKKEYLGLRYSKGKNPLINYRKENNIYDLLSEYHRDAVQHIRKDLLLENNKIPAIKSVAVPVCSVSESVSNDNSIR